MDRLVQMSKEQYVAAMRPDMERILGQIADAVNDAPDGHLINGSEMKVRDLMGQLRTLAYEKAVQMRIDQTEGAFSPSEGRQGECERGQGQVASNGSDQQRSHRPSSPALAYRGRRIDHAGGSTDRLVGIGGERGGSGDGLSAGDRRGQL